MNVKSAAAYLDMSEDALRSLVKRGDIQPHRSENNGLRFKREQLDAWAMGGV
jgi:excisionase family DNA binding protein